MWRVRLIASYSQSFSWWLKVPPKVIFLTWEVLCRWAKRTCVDRSRTIWRSWKKRFFIVFRFFGHVLFRFKRFFFSFKSNKRTLFLISQKSLHFFNKDFSKKLKKRWACRLFLKILTRIFKRQAFRFVFFIFPSRVPHIFSLALPALFLKKALFQLFRGKNAFFWFMRNTSVP